jgi:peroxiredoxin
VLLQKERELAESVKARWTPTAVLMDAGGRIASHITAGDSAIRALVNDIKSRDLNKEFTYFSNGDGHSHSNKVGQSVPAFSVEDIAGRKITADDLKGHQTLVTFWSPTCPFCQQMLDDLREWEKVKGKDDPALVVFSDGDAEEHDKIGLRSPLILDKGHQTAAGFGMFGTPSAVLINEDGRFISETATGAPDIWALVGKHK